MVSVNLNEYTKMQILLWGYCLSPQDRAASTAGQCRIFDFAMEDHSPSVTSQNFVQRTTCRPLTRKDMTSDEMRMKLRIVVDRDRKG